MIRLAFIALLLTTQMAAADGMAFFIDIRHPGDVAIVLSPDEFRRLSEAASGKVSPAVQRLHAESARHWSEVYEALAK